MESKRKQQGATLEFSVTLTYEEVAAYIPEALKELGADLALPGFRKGKAPADAVQKHFGEAKVFANAANLAIRAAAGELLSKDETEVVGEPQITVTKLAPGNPLEFRLTAGIMPKIELGDWRKVHVTPQVPEVSDKDIEETLEWLQKSRATLRQVLRPAARGDFVEISFSTAVDGNALEGGSSPKHSFIVGEGRFVPGFEEQVLGMSVGEERTFRLPFPAEWPTKQLAGKDAEFRVKLFSVQERILPGIDGAFANDVGRFNGVPALRDSIRAGLLEEKKGTEQRRVQMKVIEELAKRIVGDVPDVLVAAEQARLEDEIRASIESGGITFDDYLVQLGATLEKFREGLVEGARTRAKSALVLRAIANVEELEPTDEEIAHEVDGILRAFRDAAQAHSTLDPESLRSYARSRIRNRMALDLITKTVTGNE